MGRLQEMASHRQRGKPNDSYIIIATVVNHANVVLSLLLPSFPALNHLSVVLFYY